MNTKMVSEILNVSPKTIQRWVKQLELDLNRNELGHFMFEEEDVEVLREIKKQLQNSVLLQDVKVVVKKKHKKDATSGVSEIILDKINDLERKLDQKADSVTSYQLLQHRMEIEELHEQIMMLNERIQALENNQMKNTLLKSPFPVLDQTPVSARKKRTKMKSLLTMLFSF